jgi:hypothetical protein
MRSDFYDLPWAAQQAIRRGKRDADTAVAHACLVIELQAKVEELKSQLVEANAIIAALKSEKQDG